MHEIGETLFACRQLIESGCLGWSWGSGGPGLYQSRIGGSAGGYRDASVATGRGARCVLGPRSKRRITGRGGVEATAICRAAGGGRSGVPGQRRVRGFGVVRGGDRDRGLPGLSADPSASGW